MAQARSEPPGATRPPRSRRPLGNRLAGWTRWLHNYLSMLGLAATLFFSVTGLTLNHPEWAAGAERTTQAEGRADPAWFGPGPDAVDDLAIVEHMRKAHGVRGAVTEFRSDEYECVVTFKAPGYDAGATIDRESGRYEVTQTSAGLIAVLNDLHKGRDTGKAWSWVIDVSAVALVVISGTGLILLLTLRRRRGWGLAVGVLGTLAVVAVAVWLVP